MTCTTHHHACECREEYIRQLEAQVSVSDASQFLLRHNFELREQRATQGEKIKQLEAKLKNIEHFLVLAKSIESDGEGCKSKNVDKALAAIREKK